MIASLPMYDRPENAAAHDALWSLIRDNLRTNGISAPETLDRATPHMEGWARPDLVLGQICNLPYRALFRGKVTLIGAADYGVPDAGPGQYYSQFIVRADDPATDPTQCTGYRFVLSEPLSQSGWGAANDWARAHDHRLTPVLRSGGHRNSLLAVVEGRADLASIDAITLRNLLRWEPAAQQIRIIGRTHATPGMTFITALGRDPAPCFAAIDAAIRALSPTHRDTLGLRGIVALPPSAYDIPLPPVPDLPEHQAVLA